MTKDDLRQLIEVAAGREPADLVIQDCQLVDVAAGVVRSANIAIWNGYIAGVEDTNEPKYQGKETLDASGLFALPGLMDAHIHIESSYLTPEEFARLVVPYGTTTVVADPHEIANVEGLAGVKYMQEAARLTPLKIEYMLPSCVPSTDFENAGAKLLAQDLEEPLNDERILGLGEMMNFPGVVYNDPEVLDKLVAAHSVGKPIDGHSPGLHGKELTAYAAAGIRTDHECSTLAEMQERLQHGMYVLLRHGSSSHDLEKLLPGITTLNSRRCLLCSDDRHASTMLTSGHINEHLQLCVKHGLDPVVAVQMATLNTAEAYGFKDRGLLTPGKMADLVLVENLQDFVAKYVFIDGELVARDGEYLPPVKRADASAVRNSFHVCGFSARRLIFDLGAKMPWSTPTGTINENTIHPGNKSETKVYAIEINPGSLVTKKTPVSVTLDDTGDIVFDSNNDLVRLAVVERHSDTANVGLGLLKNYGLRTGAIAISIAHDSHNIVSAGRDPEEMALAVDALIEQEGGIVLVKDGAVLARLPLPIAGLMSDMPAEELSDKLAEIQALAHDELGISPGVDPVMTLSFMPLAVIPELKLTDLGLFDVNEFRLIDIEV